MRSSVYQGIDSSRAIEANVMEDSVRFVIAYDLEARAIHLTTKDAIDLAYGILEKTTSFKRPHECKFKADDIIRNKKTREMLKINRAFDYTYEIKNANGDLTMASAQYIDETYEKVPW